MNKKFKRYMFHFAGFAIVFLWLPALNGVGERVCTTTSVVDVVGIAGLFAIQFVFGYMARGSK